MTKSFKTCLACLQGRWKLLGYFLALLIVGGGMAAVASQPLLSIGNGRLGVALDAHGRMLSCRWPSPGHFEHLASALRVYALDNAVASAPYGVGWTLYDGQAYILPDAVEIETAPEAPVLRGRSIWSEAGVELKHTWLVAPHEAGAADILVDHAQLLQAGDTTAYQLSWHAAFQPTNRHAPELPGGFAFWERGGRHARLFFEAHSPIYAYCPHVDETMAWEQFLEAEPHDREAMRQLGPGVWIASWSRPVPSVVMQRQASEAPEPVRPGLDTSLSARALHFTIEPNSAYTVYSAFGATLEAVEAGMQHVEHAGMAGLEAACQSYWDARETQRNNGIMDSAQEDAMAQEDLAAIRSLRRVSRQVLTIHRNEETGAVVSYEARPAPFYGMTPELGAWAAYAFAADGQWHEARALIGFLRAQIRADQAQGKPLGSMPVAVYADGVEATPHWWLHTRGVAWWLGAIRHVHRLSPEEEQMAFLEENLDAVKLVGDFLAGRLHPSSGEPLPDFNSAVLRDQRSIEADLLHYVGLSSAVEILELAAASLPALWMQSLEDLETYLAFERLNQTIAWELDAALPFWMAGLLPPEDRLWEAQVDTPTGWLPMYAMVAQPAPDMDADWLAQLRASPLVAAQTLLRWGNLMPEPPTAE